MEGQQALKIERYLANLDRLAFHTPVVSVQNGYKAYSKGNCILKNLNMTVSRGSIYGLLGASGCGKTTILSCIVGLRQMDSGEIKVFGHKPGTRESRIPGRRLGYMPQDTALYPHLTIKELLQYFGRIYGLSELEILNRVKFFTEFLHLPSSSSRISDLSGGQQRRVSLATALVGEPELLILDEPTVGVDPLLRINIWNYLVQITNMGRTTVIITTHYIEEARQSHTVGLMRNGRLLVEDSPDILLKEHKASLLEDVVLRLCRKDQLDASTALVTANSDLTEISLHSKTKEKHNFSGIESIVGLKYKRRNPSATEEASAFKQGISIMENFQKEMKARSNRIQALVTRNFINYIRNPVLFLGILALPVFSSVLTSAAVGDNVRDMKIGVVNEELPNWKEVCMTASSAYKPEGLKNLSCRFLHRLPDEVYTLVPYGTKENAIKDVHAGRIWGLLTFPDGYSENFALRVASRNYADNETTEGSNVALQLDQSNYISTFLMVNTIYESFETYVTQLASDFDRDPREFKVPIEYRNPVYGTRTTSYNEYITPPAMALIIFFISMAASAINFVSDKRMGTLERSRSAGVQTFDLLVSYFITEGLAIVVQTLATMAILVVGFNFRIEGSYVLYALLCVLVGLVGQTWGFIIGIAVGDETSALLVELLIFQPLMLFTGVTWPLEAVPKYLRYFCYSLPITLASDSLRSVTTRGLVITHPLVWPGFAVAIAWILMSSIIAVVLYRRMK